MRARLIRALDGLRISVLPTSSDGFTVSLNVNQRQRTVFFNGGMKTSHKEDEALDCFAFGLSDEAN